jgi:YD repeat-containing protein
MTDPRSNVHTFQYDDSGRLLADSDTAGGSKTLTRTGTDSHYVVGVTTAEGRTSSHQVDQDPDGSEIRQFTDSADLTTVTVRTAAGQLTTFSPDGTSSDSRSIGDPRFGLTARFPRLMTFVEPGLGQLTLSQTRSYTLSGDPSHPVTSATSTFTLNGRTSSSLFNGSSRSVVQTSPAGRTLTSHYDARGHLAGTEIPGLTPIAFSYDTTGLPIMVTQLNRTITLGYDTQRRLHSVTDPLQRIVSFDYDAADRVTRQTLPDGRSIQFVYDANGNLTSVVPPGRPAHLFVYTPVDLASSYSPPTVPNGGATLYTFNRDRQLTLVSRPDGRSVSLGYDFAGRLSTLDIARGTYTNTYDDPGRLASVTAPDGGSITYAYNGSLLQSATSTGEVSGSIAWTYDIDLAVVSETVACASAPTAACQPVFLSYDADKLLRGAGALTLTRDPQNGLVTGTTAGGVTDAWTYNTFGEPLTHTASFGSTPLFSEQFQRDDAGRIGQKSETLNGTSANGSYTYDDAGRLTDVAGDRAAHYTYDSNSNRLTRITPSPSDTASYDDQDRLLTYNGAQYSYTANGELESKTDANGTTTYGYDELGNLVHVVLPSRHVIDYVIDGQNRRVGKKIDGTLVSNSSTRISFSRLPSSMAPVTSSAGSFMAPE